MNARSVAAAIALTILTNALLAQSVPPRDQSAPALSGTARIRGRVVAADTGTPLRRAEVHLMASERGVHRTISTDADGVFEAVDLPPGRYLLTVSRNGYASLQFGQQRPFEPGRPLDLANGQFADRVDFALPRGGVITGRITDQLGEPVAGVPVQAMRYRYLPGGSRHLVAASIGGPFAMVTNDLGEFRVFGLMPGTYLVSANPPGNGSRFAGGIVTAMQFNGDSFGYATTFYPGTLNAEQAEPIQVGVGDMTSVSFALSTTRLTRISGTVRDSQGRPVTGGRLSLRWRYPTGGGGMMSGPQIGAEGRFSIASVPPGDYSLEVAPTFGGSRPSNAQFDEVASVPFTAAGRDITDLLITTSPGATVTGRVIFEGTSDARKPDRVTAESPDDRMDVVYNARGDNGAIDATGRFQLRGVIGRALFRTGYMRFDVAVARWALKSVTLNGNDITDTPIDIQAAGDITGIEITLIDALTHLSGSVTNARRETAGDYVVVILPERLKEGTLQERFTRTARPNQEGRYQIDGLPAGDYLAVAVSALEDGNEWDPAFRKQVERTATRFRLTHRETATLNLELVP